MKLSARDAAAYFRKPDPGKAGLLIHGADAMRVALRRQEVIKSLVGPEGEEEMRLTRFTGAELRKDKTVLLDAVKAQGFFPGPRVVFVDEAADGLADTVRIALDEWRTGDAQMVLTAGALNARSALRKLFEGGRETVSVGVYDDPPSRDEIEAVLREVGLTDIPGEAMRDLTDLSRALDPGDFRQTMERIGLYKLNDPKPLTSDEIALLAPASVEAGVDDVLHVVAEMRAAEIGPVLSRLRDQGVTPVALSIAATRHFRTLHRVAADPGGPGAGIGKLRPPVYGPRRDRIERQARAWGMRKLEEAISILIDTDLTLRSAAQVPAMGLMERTFLRLAMLGAR